MLTNPGFVRQQQNCQLKRKHTLNASEIPRPSYVCGDKKEDLRAGNLELRQPVACPNTSFKYFERLRKSLHVKNQGMFSIDLSTGVVAERRENRVEM